MPTLAELRHSVLLFEIDTSQMEKEPLRTGVFRFITVSEARAAKALPEGTRWVIVDGKADGIARVNLRQLCRSEGRTKIVFREVWGWQLAEQLMQSLIAPSSPLLSPDSSSEVEIIPHAAPPKPQPQPVAEAVPIAPPKYPEVGTVIWVPVAKVRPNPNQIRTYFDPEKLAALGRSIKKFGQEIAATVMIVTDDPNHDFQITDGERRWKACKLAGVEIFKVLPEGILDPKLQYRKAARSNFGREGHQHLEIAHALKRIKEEYNLTHAELADEYAASVSWVTQHLGLLKMHPAAQAAMDPHLPEERQLIHSIALEVAKAPFDRQEAAVQHILDEQLTLPQVRHYIRKITSEHGFASPQRKRKPSDDYLVLTAFVRSSLEKTGQLLDMPEHPLAELFYKRSREDGDQVVADLTTLIARLVAMRDSIGAVVEANRSAALRKPVLPNKLSA